MWRQAGEANLPRLAGAKGYDKQVSLSRSIPMWGGLSETALRQFSGTSTIRRTRNSGRKLSSAVASSPRGFDP